MIFAIRAYDQIFGGLHGIEDFEVIEARDRDEAYEYGANMSRDLIESYWNEFESYYEDEAYAQDIDEDDDEFYDEWINETTACDVYEVCLDDDDVDLITLNQEFNEDWQAFVYKLCKG